MTEWNGNEYQMQLLCFSVRELDKEKKQLDLSAQKRKPVPLLWKFCSSPAGFPALVGAETSSVPASPFARISPVTMLMFDVSKHVGLDRCFRRRKLTLTSLCLNKLPPHLISQKCCKHCFCNVNLIGKDQEACSALTLEQTLDYEVVKATVLRKCVPEAYWKTLEICGSPLVKS